MLFLISVYTENGIGAVKTIFEERNEWCSFRQVE